MLESAIFLGRPKCPIDMLEGSLDGSTMIGLPQFNVGAKRRIRKTSTSQSDCRCSLGKQFYILRAKFSRYEQQDSHNYAMESCCTKTVRSLAR
jgi:hypothetical protein